MDSEVGLRKNVGGTIAKHMELIHKPKIKHSMRKYNNLALGVLEQKAEELGWGN